MDVFGVLSLQHLASTRIATLLFNKNLKGIAVACLTPNLTKEAYLDLREFRDEEYQVIRSEIFEDMTKLNINSSLQEKLELFIAHLFTEIEEWIDTCFLMWSQKDDTFLFIMDNIPQCWLLDGTIDREKSAMLVVKNKELHLMNRFIFACFYCIYEEIPNLWEQLSPREQFYLKERTDLKNDKDFVVTQWIEWLEGPLNKDWQFCVAWILGTELWKINVCVMKRVLLALSPKERRDYMWKSLTTREVDSDVMRFCLSLMSRDEQRSICRISAFEVIKCVACWPLRSRFNDVADTMRPYIKIHDFCEVITMLLMKIKKERWDFIELIIITKAFWFKSPEDIQYVAKRRLRCFNVVLDVILGYERSEEFTKEELLECFILSPY